MDITRFSLKKFSVITVLFFLINSCSKEDQVPEHKYFVSATKSASFTAASINIMLDGVVAFVPQISELKPLVSSDISIFRIVYKTTIDSIGIKASGLVCVPKTPGDYPVLSFQNGTNTLNSHAPSMDVFDYSYQLVEIIASMGYIVLIADYPGFGESAHIPHPYLVEEPTVQSLVDMLYAVKEMDESELSDITVKNEYYLLGYSQGGWATLALHKSLELDYNKDFNLAGSACGAGPYDISVLLQQMISEPTYPMPVYLGYIINAYTSYRQFTNPVSDLFNKPYATKLCSLYNGLLSSEQINSELTTSIPGLLNPDFLDGFNTDTKYLTVKTALEKNSIEPWQSNKPLLLIHGGNDTQVFSVSTEKMYNTMVQSGTSTGLIEKVILPGLDHGDGVVPCMTQSILFLNNLNASAKKFEE
jgi:pimeloyl-ACP methyl ester carboxylesterase